MNLVIGTWVVIERRNNTDLIWGGDHDAEDSDTFSMVTNLSCPKCHSFVEVYYPSEETIKEYDKEE